MIKEMYLIEIYTSYTSSSCSSSTIKPAAALSAIRRFLLEASSSSCSSRILNDKSYYKQL